MVERYRDSIRLFRLLGLIQGRGRALSDLRSVLSVSPATLRRDLSALRSCGFVIDEFRGPAGKVVRCNATTLSLSPTTAAWLLLTTLFDEVHGGIAEEELSVLRQTALERFDLDPASLASRLFRQPSPREVATLGPCLETALDATLRDRILEIRYRAWAAEERSLRIAPWSIARLGDRLYVLGPEVDRSELPWAAWRIDRITSACVTRTAFQRPTSWDPAQAYAGRFGAFHGEEAPVWVVLRLDPRRGEALLRSGLPSIAHRSRTEGERVILELLVHPDRAFLQWVLHLGEEAEVLDPPNVRRAVGAIYRRQADLYADGVRD